jgi:peptide/nickel transport system substrate-binding protein
MRSSGRRRFTALGPVLLAVLIATAGCTPGSAGERSTAPPGAPAAGSRAETGPAQSSAPKLLRIGMVDGREPKSGLALGAGGIGGAEHTFTFHAGLTIYDPQGNLGPHIAERVPSVDQGDWKVNPDGTMEVTWKLRPGVKWHDGTPLTSTDFAFGMTILKDREIPFARSRAASLITEIRTPDPQTMVVMWEKPYTYANTSGPVDIPAVPAHILRSLYDGGDKQAVTNSPYWSTEFVGLGPYKLGPWVLGSQLEAEAFDAYFLGRPKIDRLVFRYLGDANVLYATLLAGEIDLVPFGSFQADHFVLLKQSWEASGAGTAVAVFSGTRNYRYQLRDPALPWSNLQVRRALIHLLDRQELADALLAGLSAPADLLIAPSNPVYPLVEQRGFQKYPYDTAQAQRLLEQAGWQRGAGGLYRNAAGQPLAIEVRSTDYVANVKEAEAVAGQWRAGGLEVTTLAVPDSAPRAYRDEMRHTFPGVLAGPLRDNHDSLEAFISSQTGTQANRWSGDNRGGYSSPLFDQLYDRSIVALNPSERQGLIADMLKLEVDEAVSIHLFYDMAQQTVAFRKGIRGPAAVSSMQLASHWNIHTWVME